MCTILDEVDPADIEPSFNHIFRKLQHGKVLEPMVFMEDFALRVSKHTSDDLFIHFFVNIL